MSIFPNPSPGSGSEPPYSPPPAPPPPPSAPPPGAPAYYAPPPQYYAPPPPPAPASGGLGWKIGVLFGVVVALIAANVYLYMQLDKVKKDLTAANDTAQSRLDKLEEADIREHAQQPADGGRAARSTGARPPASQPGRRTGQGRGAEESGRDARRAGSRAGAGQAAALLRHFESEGVRRHAVLASRHAK